MATNKNTGMFKEITEAGNLQSGIDQIPADLSKGIVYTCEVNPKMLRVANVFTTGSILNNATTATVYTTPTDKDFYLTGCSLAYIKDATSTATVMSIRSTLDGQVRNFISLPSITLTAGTGQLAISFPFPIKLDKNVTVQLTSDTNVANIRVSGGIVGYVTEAQGR